LLLVTRGALDVGSAVRDGWIGNEYPIMPQ